MIKNSLKNGAKNTMKTTLVLLSLLITTSSNAEVKNYSMQNQKFQLELPSGWNDVEDFAGSPLVFFGPENQDVPRSVITIAPTGEEDKNHFFSEMKKNVAEYKIGREDWLKGSFGESISYDKYKEEKWSGIERAHLLGYHYELPSGKFYERSSYILCGGNKLFYIKSLVPEQFESTHNALVEQTIKSLKCEKSPIKTAKN
jgi:hypothetical protein